MRFKLFSLASLTVAAAVSCDTLKHDQGTNIVLEGSEIAFVTHTEGTKAFAETLNSTLEANGWNCRAMINGSEPVEMFNTTLRLDGNVFRDPAKTWYFPLEGTMSFYGVYPTSLAISSSNTITYTADYETDIVTAKAEGVAKQDNAVSMNFSHILSQVDVKMKGGDSNVDYVLESFTVISPSGGTYNIVSDAWTPSATSEKSCTLVTTSIPTGDYIPVVNPMTFLPGDAQVRVAWKSYMKGTTILVGSYGVTLNVNLEKGAHTTLNVVLSSSANSSIRLSSAVSPWTRTTVNLDTEGAVSGPVVNLAMVKATDGSSLSSESTANCYVVRANGKYKIPLVYGNAIKNGKTNTSAFYNAAASTAFEDSYGGVFTASSSPYIKDHASVRSASISSAEVLWIHGDAQVSVEDVDSDYLTFSVSSFAPSNALIAVKDNNGTILWSWHLWLTNQDLSPVTITNHDGDEFQIMPVALGWNGWTTETVDGEVQDRSTAPYFEWGRKDPLIPIGVGIPVPGGSIDYSNSVDTQSQAHQNPTVFYTYSDNWCTTAANYFWDADNTATNTDSPVVKTIYDPCPAGWNVPQYNTFTGFTTTGQEAETSLHYNVVGSFDKGWKFKRNSDDVTGIFFPAAGVRQIDRALLILSVTDFGNYWLSVPESAHGGNFLNFESINIKPQSRYTRAIGYCVWPALSQN